MSLLHSTLEQIIETESLGIQNAMALNQRCSVWCGDVWNLSQDANSETVEKEVSERVRDLELCVYFSPACLSLLGSIRRGLLSWLHHPDL